jgi:hypothetical protein
LEIHPVEQDEEALLAGDGPDKAQLRPPCEPIALGIEDEQLTLNPSGLRESLLGNTALTLVP